MLYKIYFRVRKFDRSYLKPLLCREKPHRTHTLVNKLSKRRASGADIRLALYKASTRLGNETIVSKF